MEVPTLITGDTSKVIIDFIVEGSQRESTFTKTRMRDELLHIIFAVGIYQDFSHIKVGKLDKNWS